MLGRVTTRTVLEVDQRHGDLALAGGYLSRELSPHLHVEAGATWTRGLGTTLSLFVSTLLPSLRATTSMTAPPVGGAMVSQFVQGSVLYDPARRQVAFASGPSLERAGISGRVFLDGNGDGRWQPERADDQRRAGAGGIRDRAVRLLGPLPDLGPSGIRAGAGRGGLQHPRVAALEAGLRLGQRRDRPQPVPRASTSPSCPAGVIEGRVVRQTVDSTVPVAGLRLLLRRHGSSQTRPARHLLRRRLLSHRGEARRPTSCRWTLRRLRGWSSRPGRSGSPCPPRQTARRWTGSSCCWSERVSP